MRGVRVEWLVCLAAAACAGTGDPRTDDPIVGEWDWVWPDGTVQAKDAIHFGSDGTWTETAVLGVAYGGTWSRESEGYYVVTVSAGGARVEVNPAGSLLVLAPFIPCPDWWVASDLPNGLLAGSSWSRTCTEPNQSGPGEVAIMQQLTLNADGTTQPAGTWSTTEMGFDGAGRAFIWTGADLIDASGFRHE